MREKLIKSWVEKAEKDIGLAEMAMRKHKYPDLICFHFQQAAEKFLKALILKFSDKAPRTHSLSYLLDLLEEHLNIPEEIQEAILPLEDYSVATRYPGLPEPNWTDVDFAHKATLKIREFIKDTLKL